MENKTKDYSTLLKGCYFPYTPKDNPLAKYACGKCPNCLKRRVDHWAFRISYHARFVKHIYFVTLTYETGIDVTPNGLFTLTPDHFRNYMKRIRKDMGQNKNTPENEKVKYIVTGEYGAKRKRPHFHAIILNVPIEQLQKHWQYGIVDIRPFNLSRTAYVFKYTQKGNKRRKLEHSRDDRVPEYVNFSQGLGQMWLTDKHIRYHKENIANPTITLPTGERISIPRYYKNKMFTDEERQRIADQMMELANKEYDPTEHLSPAEQQMLLQWKNEKIRLMNKKSKKEKNE